MMEHREGATLADEISRAPFPVQELLRRAIDLASALSQLHRQGRVYGAVEPAAIIATAGGVQLFEPVAGPRAVTPYTAPEQLYGAGDARSDIFAFGAVVYEMATGHRAFDGEEESALERAIQEAQPPSLALLPHDDKAAAFYIALDRVVSGCLVKNPDQRRQRMHNVLVDLKLMSSAARAATPKTPVVVQMPAPKHVPPARETLSGPLELKGVELALPPAAPLPEAIPFKAAEASPKVPVPEPAPPTAEPVVSTGPEPTAVPGQPVALPPSPAEGRTMPVVPPPTPAPYQQPAALVPDSLRLSSPALEEEAAAAAQPGTAESEEDRAIAERRASAILSQVGFGQTAPYVMDPSELKEHKRAKKDKTDEQRELQVPEPPAPVATPEIKHEDRTRVRIQLDSKAQKQYWIWVFTAGIAVAVLAVMAFAAWAATAYLRKSSSGPGQLRFALPAPEQASYMSSPAISPDGKLLAFSAVGTDKKRMLFIRPLNSLKSDWLANTEEALAPFWSPDGKYVGFFAGKKLKKIPAEGGPVTVLCDTEGLAGGGAWSRDGVIVFGRSFYDSLYRVSAAGGTPQRVTELDSSRGERAHLWPVFLPDGKHFIFYALAEQEDNNGVSIASLDSKMPRHLLSADTNALYAEKPSQTGRQGYLLYAHSHRLTAQAFDPVKLALGDDQFTVADEINYLEFINLLPISAAANGVLAYQSIDVPKRQLVWLDRDGNQVGTLGEPGEYKQVRISPDGRHVAVNRQTPGRDTADLWLFEVESGRGYQFTSEPTHEGAPVWSPDGTELVYFSNPNGHFDLFRKSMGTSSRQEPLAVSGADKYPNDWSSDGKYLLYGSIGGSTNSDLWVLPMKGKGDPFPYLQTVNSEGYAQFSPDARWVAYQSDETGRGEVYVEPFPRVEGHSRRWQISTDGGGLPKWRGDGKELYYIMGNGRVMAVQLNTKEGLSPSAPRILFQTRALPRDWNMFDATADGRRFLVNTPLEWASSSPITVVANWAEGFKRP
jgi:Tol biopolymer transport system component